MGLLFDFRGFAYSNIFMQGPRLRSWTKNKTKNKINLVETHECGYAPS